MPPAPSPARIVVTSPSFSQNPLLAGEVRREFPGAKLNLSGKRLAGEELAEFIGDAEGVIVGLEAIDARVLARCRALRIVSKYGVGLDNIDAGECRERGVAIGWKGGTNRLSVAEMTLGFMLSLCRNLFGASAMVKAGVWKKEGGRLLSGRKVGIIGVGNIGQEVVRLLAPFGCDLRGNDIEDRSGFYRAHGMTDSGKEEIYRWADIVTVHTPLTPETEGMIGREALSMMGRHAFLINTARGRIVVQEELKRALRERRIAGAAIDVYEEEPPADPEFLGLPNLICTPHIGGNAHEAILAMGRAAIDRLKEFFRA